MTVAAEFQSSPQLQALRGKTVVIKYGGNAMLSPELQQAFADDIAFLRAEGVNVVVVHGGGPQISAMLTTLGIESEFRGGYRVTTPEAIDVVRMVLTGVVNPELVRGINQHGPIAAGVSGEDAGLFGGRRRGTVVDGEPVDLGLVGDVVEVNPQIVRDHLDAGRVPVVSGIAPELENPSLSLNVNADAAAGALAAALVADILVVLTDVAGLYSDWPNRDSLVTHITSDELRELMPSLESGMIPKMQACLDAVVAGVTSATIIDGREPHAVLTKLLTNNTIGTEVVQ